MENQQYLDQISAASSTTPVQPKNGLSGILHSKIFLVLMAGLVAFILLAIIGSLLSGNKPNSQTNILKLKLHADSTMDVINSYQSNIKSSNLRSSSASFNSILADTSSKLGTYLTEKYGDKTTESTKNLAEEATTTADATKAELFEAKINGNLDRVYAHKMAYEISVFLSEEEKLYNTTNDTDLQSILNSSYTSLENLYSNFNDFSETKQ